MSRGPMSAGMGPMSESPGPMSDRPDPMSALPGSVMHALTTPADGFWLQISPRSQSSAEEQKSSTSKAQPKASPATNSAASGCVRSMVRNGP